MREREGAGGVVRESERAKERGGREREKGRERERESERMCVECMMKLLFVCLNVFDDIISSPNVLIVSRFTGSFHFYHQLFYFGEYL